MSRVQVVKGHIINVENNLIRNPNSQITIEVTGFTSLSLINDKVIMKIISDDD